MNTPPETLPTNPSSVAGQLTLPGCDPAPSAVGQNFGHSAVPAPVDPDTEAELAEHEATIADSLTNAFVRAGNALQIILDKKLYKNQFDSFDAYVQSRWGWQRAHAYRLIQAAQIVGGLSPIGDTLPMPTSESQLRPLSRLDGEMQRLVWLKAVDNAGGRTPTADIVKAAVTVVVGPRKKPSATVTADLDEGKATGTSNGRTPAEQQAPELVLAAPVLPANSHHETTRGNLVDHPVDLALVPPVFEAAIGIESSRRPGKTGPTADSTPAAMNAAPASHASETVQPETAFILADGTEVPATDWVDGWIASKWIAGMLHDLERQSSLAVPVSAQRCARRQRLLITLAAGLNRSGEDPDPEYLRDAEDALGNVRNIVRTHSNYPHLIKRTTESLESAS